MNIGTASEIVEPKEKEEIPTTGSHHTIFSLRREAYFANQRKDG